MALNNFSDNQAGDQGFKNMPSNQKTVFISLSILGLAVMVLGVWQLVNKINSPFRLSEAELAAEGMMRANIVDQSVDTDGDGLTDYEEIFIYGTSPYLEDTDGDGISDKDEIERGTNPNCPEGQDCFSLNNFTAQPETPQGSGVSEEILPGLGDIGLTEEITEEDMRQALAGEMDVATLRQLLLESGADKEVLYQISDEDLLQSYQEVLNNNNEEE